MSVLAPFDDSTATVVADPAPAPARAAGWRAHKFGGSSVADATRYRHVAALLREEPAAAQVIVVSAMRGVTDALVALAADAGAGHDTRAAMDALRERHLQAARELDPDAAHGLERELSAEFDALRRDLDAWRRDHGRGSRACEAEVSRVIGLGEVWSAGLLQAAVGGLAAGWARLDAREVLVVQPGELGVGVDWERSGENLASWRAAHPQAKVVVTGFVASDAAGRPTTLGRNGSDYSGAIFAVLFGAVELTIWTDVDGVLSADPRQVPDAVCLDAISYAEACELAYFGAKVLHPQTMAPAMRHGVPIRIRNTLDPAAVGTLISQQSTPAHSPVKGLSLVDDAAVLELAGAGLIGVPGTAERMFAALRDAGVSVTMITQGSSEHSICCVLPAAQAETARGAVARAFVDSIAAGQVEGVRITPGVAVLAAVGDGMVGTHGVAARLFDGLARARVNVRAIAQGASERSISVAVAAADATRALRAAHSAFWLSPQTLSIGLIGPGHVGRALLRQLAQAQTRLFTEDRIDLRLRALAGRQQMACAEARLDPTQAFAALADGERCDLDAFAAHVRAEHLPHAVIVDCSGSDAIAAHYERWLAAGIHVVTPSKHAGSGPLDRYTAIHAARRSGAQFRYEATVGAGLPVIQTLRSLLDTGDELIGIEGVLSGTLAWLFDGYDGQQPFSERVLQARACGYTEPDPRDDLSGLDVARKLVILAREAGRNLSLADVQVENLVPAALREVPLAQFLQRLPELDAGMKARLDADGNGGGPLRYLARLDHDGARVGLIAPAAGHVSLNARRTDNVIAFHTRRYAVDPLVVQGPGAGPEVTAAGVFGDILMIARGLR